MTSIDVKIFVRARVTLYIDEYSISYFDFCEHGQGLKLCITFILK